MFMVEEESGGPEAIGPRHQWAWHSKNMVEWNLTGTCQTIGEDNQRDRVGCGTDWESGANLPVFEGESIFRSNTV